MNTARDNNGQKSAGIWQNLRLVPLFSLIFGGILLLFALCIGVASYFLISGNHSSMMPQTKFRFVWASLTVQTICVLRA